jgi:RNA polymerase sigma-70 factor (ECF subfamily)
MRIVTNTCYDMLRAQKRRAADSLDDLPVDADHASQLIDPAASPEDEVERSELQALIESAINSLPEDQRLALILCDVEGYAYDEIAQITESAMGTVKSRISRARKRVQAYLLASRSELLPSAYRPMGSA